MLLDELDVLDIVALRGTVEHELVADDLDERGMRDTGEGDRCLAGVKSRIAEDRALYELMRLCAVQN